MAASPINIPASSPYGATLTFLQSFLGYILREVETTPSISTTAVQILTQNGDRLGFVVANTSTQTVTIGLSAAVTATAGIMLNAQTGVISVIVRDDFTLCSHEWWAIAGAGPQAIYVLEIIGIKALPPGSR
jgi:hypothetical protein